MADNGSEYIIKGPSLVPGHPYVAANELIAARLGERLGVPMLDYRVLEMNGQLFFGSGWMEADFQGITASLLQGCSNREVGYLLAAFDVWIGNQDRHEGNLLIRTNRRGGAEHHFILANDHSHCLMVPGWRPDDLHQLHDLVRFPLSCFIRLPFVSQAITDAGPLRQAIMQVAGLPDAAVQGVIREVPEPFLPVGERQPLEDFLLTRKKQLLQVFQAGAGMFTNLQGGPL